MPAKQVIETYSRRMNIEQRLAEAIRSFHLDSLTGAVPLNIDLDVVLTVLAHTLCAALRRRIPGYETATPDTLQRRFLSTGGHILGPRQPIRGSPRPAHLLTRTAPSHPARDLRPLARWPHRALRVRVRHKMRGDSLSENRR